MIDKEQIRTMCEDEKGRIKPKPECRAEIINRLILEDGRDIDEAEDVVDKAFLEFNLWGEPKLEDLLKEETEK